MIVALDCNALIAWSGSDNDSVARIEHLCSGKNVSIIVPTPALAEFLVRADQELESWIVDAERSKSFRIIPFDKRCAWECAIMGRNGLSKKKAAGNPYQKVKIDRQICAIAKTHSASVLLTNDKGLKSIAQSNGLNAVSIEELELPEHARQIQIDFKSQE
jgi:hypothetical protein bpseu9_40260